MEFYEYLIGVQDPQSFAISLTVAFRRERVLPLSVLGFTASFVSLFFGTFHKLGHDRSNKMYRTRSSLGTYT